MPRSPAQVAELVDALVSNTNVFGRAGSTPALGTRNPFRRKSEGIFLFYTKHETKSGGEVYSEIGNSGLG